MLFNSPVLFGCVMKNMGSVIMSAAIILAGTFAAMFSSGMLSFLQIATLVLTAFFFTRSLSFHCFMIRIFGRADRRRLHTK